MSGRRWVDRTVLLAGFWAVWIPAARGQSGAEATSSGVGVVAIPSMGSGPGSFGLMAVPVPTGTGGQSGGAAGLAGSADPLGLGAVYGPAVPMTPGQAGLMMLATQQRMLGLGNGRLSGVRPGADGDRPAARPGRGTASGRPAEAHTRNSNVPGGQASRYFNRGGLAASQPRPYYNRQLRHFPQGGQ